MDDSDNCLYFRVGYMFIFLFFFEEFVGGWFFEFENKGFLGWVVNVGRGIYFLMGR